MMNGSDPPTSLHDDYATQLPSYSSPWILLCCADNVEQRAGCQRNLRASKNWRKRDRQLTWVFLWCTPFWSTVFSSSPRRAVVMFPCLSVSCRYNLIITVILFHKTARQTGRESMIAQDGSQWWERHSTDVSGKKIKTFANLRQPHEQLWSSE